MRDFKLAKKYLLSGWLTVHGVLCLRGWGGGCCGGYVKDF